MGSHQLPRRCLHADCISGTLRPKRGPVSRASLMQGTTRRDSRKGIGELGVQMFMRTGVLGLVQIELLDDHERLDVTGLEAGTVTAPGKPCGAPLFDRYCVTVHTEAAHSDPIGVLDLTCVRVRATAAAGTRTPVISIPRELLGTDGFKLFLGTASKTRSSQPSPVMFCSQLRPAGE